MAVLSKTFSLELFEVKYLVDEEHHNFRLDQYLQLYLQSFSREQVKQKIASGDITIIDRPGKHRPSTKVHHNDIVVIKTTNDGHEDEFWRGNKLDLITTPEIIYEDEKIIVISKPPYMSTHPTGRHLFNCATVYFENIHNKTIHSIHRLDRETSGVLLLGKDPKETAKVTQQFEDDMIRKCYFWISKTKVVFEGEKEFTTNLRLGSPYEGKKRVIIKSFSQDSKEGKRAETKFKVLFKSDEYCIGLAFPRTGRQHQIRVHAQMNGLPLLGDKLYLGGYPMFQRFKDHLTLESDFEEMEISRHALHAIAINLEYQNKRQTFISDIPKDLEKWIINKLDLDLEELKNQIKIEINNYFKKDFK